MCTHANVVEYQYEKICTSCGLVLEANFCETSFKDYERISPLDELLLQHQNSMIEQRPQPQQQPQQKKQFKRFITTAKIVDVQEIKNICAREKINSSARSAIIEVWKVYNRSPKSRKGDNRKGILMNCFYRGLLANGDLRTKDEICKMFQSNQMVFKKGEKLLSPLLPNGDESVENIFYNRFVRMVKNEEGLPFHLATTMNDLYNKNRKILQTFSNHSTINTIFICVSENYKAQVEEVNNEMKKVKKKPTTKKKLVTKRKKNNFKYLCSQKGLSLPAFIKIKSML